MKQFKYLLLLFLLIPFYNLFPQPVRVELPDISICEGQTSVTVPVTFSYCDGIHGISIAFHYDPASLSYSGYSTNSTLNNGIIKVSDSNGTIIAGWASLTPLQIDTAEDLFVFQFELTGDHCNLNWLKTSPGLCELQDYDALAVPVEFINGEIKTAGWQKQASGFTVQRGTGDILATDNLHTWALAYDKDSGASLPEFTKTDDGGSTWIPGVINGYPGYGGYMITALNNDTAWIPMVNNSNQTLLMKTTDGGISWEENSDSIYIKSNGFMNAVHFWNASEGVCMGDPNNGYFEIYTTLDGGSSWTRVPSSSIPEPGFLESGIIGSFSIINNLIMFGTKHGRLFKSNDKGISWTVDTIPGINNYFNMYFRDELHGFAKVFDSAFLYKTTDGGSTWTEHYPAGSFYSNDLCYIPGTQSTWISTGAAHDKPNGCSYSTDDGFTWYPFEEMVGIQCLDACFIDEHCGWVGHFNSSSTTGGLFKFNGWCAAPLYAGFSVSDSILCQGNSVQFTADTNGNSTSYHWEFPGGTPAVSSEQNPVISYQIPGNYSVKLIISNGITSDTLEKASYITIHMNPDINAGADTSIFHGTSAFLHGSAYGGSGNYLYSWSPGSLLVNAAVAEVVTIQLFTDTTFILSVTDAETQCQGLPDSVHVTVTGSPLAVSLSAMPSAVCSGLEVQLLAEVSGGSEFYEYTWSSDPSGFASSQTNPTVSPDTTTTYFVTVDDGYNQVTGSVEVIVNNVPGAVGDISGAIVVNGGEGGVAYNVPSIYGAITYEWVYSGTGVSVQGTGNAVTLDFSDDATSGILRVRGINDCGPGGFSEDFPISLETECRPGWQIVGGFQYYMNFAFRLYFDNVLSTNPLDSVGAFINGDCRGVSERDADDPSILYLSAGSDNQALDTVRFIAWNAAACSEADIFEQYAFADTLIGIPVPVAFHTGWNEVNLPLAGGWNWISFNVNGGSMDINKVLEKLIVDNTCQIKSQGPFANYSGTKWTGALKTIDPNQMYALKVTIPQTLKLAGIPVPINTIPLNLNWTWVGYLPQIKLATKTALDSIYPSPATNSIFKDQYKFSKYIGTKWSGALDTLFPGKGYKVLLLTHPATLLYPSPAKSRSGSAVPYTEPMPSNLPLAWKAFYDKEFNLTLLCKIRLNQESFSNDPDDVIAAFVGNECRGFATPDKENPGIYFLSVNSDVPSLETIRFRYLSAAKSDIAEVIQHLRYENTEDLGTLNDPVILTLASPTGINENEIAGQTFLGENYPDPFGESTKRSDEPGRGRNEARIASGEN
ncbi:MAG: PKD domain-containing protein [Bacteroidetes bacterium]|nr:PKD domain-containing protein [Bacteroidota bacterium]